MRALAYARASRPAILEAVTVSVDPAETDALLAEWESATSRSRCGCSTLLTARSRVRSSTTSSRDAGDNPRDIVDVYVPEYVVGHWWETLLHNQSALRLKTRLRFTPGVVVVSVPYQLRSSHSWPRPTGEFRSGRGSTRRADSR